MWATWLGPVGLASTLALATDVAALGLFAVVFALRRRAPQPLYLEFGLLMLLVPMLSPQGWDYVLLIAAPAFFLLFDRWLSVSVAWRMATVVAVLLVSFTIFDVIGRAAYVRSMQLSVVTLGGALLALCLIHLRWRSLACPAVGCSGRSCSRSSRSCFTTRASSGGTWWTSASTAL